MHSEVKDLIEHYKLEPLPVENTLYVNTYRSSGKSSEGNPFGTAIIGLYCEEPLSLSLFHKLTSDEVWHFYGGDPLRLVLLYPDGSSRDVIMGADVLNGQLVQFTVPAGVWQAGHLIKGGRYSLYGCTVAPGFTGECFTGGTAGELLELYPERSDDIHLLGCGSGHTRMPEGFNS